MKRPRGGGGGRWGHEEAPGEEEKTEWHSEQEGGGHEEAWERGVAYLVQWYTLVCCTWPGPWL